MKKLTSSVIRDLLLYMIGFGIFIGLIFPFFTKAILNLPAQKVLNPTFFSMCVLAGLLVGLFNFSIFKFTVCSFLKELRNKIKDFGEKLNFYYWGEIQQLRPEECCVNFYSKDMVGELAEGFNKFIYTIFDLIKAEKTSSSLMEELHKSLKLDDMAEAMIKFFLNYFGGEAGCLITLQRGQLEVTKTWNMEFDLEKTGTEYWFSLLSEGKIECFNEIDEEELYAINVGIGKLKPRYVVHIPLSYQSNPVGILILLSRKPFLKDFEALESRNLISQATPFIYNALLMRRLELLAAIDELTGVLNRRFGMRRLIEEFERSKRHNIPLSVSMIDIDDFKKINDTYGHQCGDLVLKTLAEIISQNIRISDFVIRYGGEEFLVVTPGASSLNAAKVMERLRDLVSTYKIQYGSHELHFTFSAGVAAYPAEDIQHPSDLIKKADTALYQAKKAGKNRVIIGG